MKRPRGTLVVAGVLASAGLAGCSSTPAPSPTGIVTPQPSDPVQLAADKFACVVAAQMSTCQVQVTYTNSSTTSIGLDPSETRLIDATGTPWRATTLGATPARTDLVPGGTTAYLWTLTLPSTVQLTSVRWTGDLGDTATAPLAAGASASPTPTVTRTPTATPTPTATASKSPTPTKTPSSGGGHTSRPSPSPTQNIGSIG